MNSDVWVLVDRDKDIRNVTCEMLDEGQKIARRLESRVVALILGHHPLVQP